MSCVYFLALRLIFQTNHHKPHTICTNSNFYFLQLLYTLLPHSTPMQTHVELRLSWAVWISHKMIPNFKLRPRAQLGCLIKQWILNHTFLSICLHAQWRNYVTKLIFTSNPFPDVTINPSLHTCVHNIYVTNSKRLPFRFHSLNISANHQTYSKLNHQETIQKHFAISILYFSKLVIQPSHDRFQNF